MSNSQDLLELEGSKELKLTEEKSYQRPDSSSTDHVPNGNLAGCGSENRKRKFTEKGKNYFSEVRGKARQSTDSALSEQIKKSHQLHDNDTINEQTLEAERDCLDKLKDKSNEAQRAFDEVIDSDKDKQVSYQWFDVCDRECFQIRGKLVERIHALEKFKSESRYKSVKSSYSKKTKSSISSEKTRQAQAAQLN